MHYDGLNHLRRIVPLRALFENLQNFAAGFLSGDWKMLVMWLIGGLLIYLAIKKDMEP